METSILALSGAAAGIGLTHTLMGPDHYLPFIVMAKSRQWSMFKTFMITLLCGIGHVGSSVVLGAIGIIAGIAVGKLEAFEGVRGDWAAWILTAFGFAYMIWGIHRAIKNKPHTHIHVHTDGEAHLHQHNHHNEHAHIHDQGKKVSLTPWALFIIFILGPCEPLIPLLMFPAAKLSPSGVALVAAIFSVCTIGMMLAVVMLSSYGISFLPMKKLERYTHAVAGGTILSCGIMIHLGL